MKHHFGDTGGYLTVNNEEVYSHSSGRQIDRPTCAYKFAHTYFTTLGINEAMQSARVMGEYLGGLWGSECQASGSLEPETLNPKPRNPKPPQTLSLEP